MSNIKQSFHVFLDDLTKIFPYFFGVYIILLILMQFYPSIKISVDWRWYTFALLSYFLIFLSKKVRQDFLDKFLKPLFFRLKMINDVKLVKIFVFFVIFSVVLYFKIGLLDLFVLIYGSLSFLYVFDSRISAGTALLFLVTCPILLSLKKDGLAESFAVLAYYFLIITVLILFRELKKQDSF